MMTGAAPLMTLRDLRKTYALRQGLISRLVGSSQSVAAVDGVSLSIEPGTIVGLVGESGCGKSTLARMIVGLTPPSSGEISWRGRTLDGLAGPDRREYRSGVQMIFQDTHSSLNPRKRIGRTLDEALAARGLPKSARPARTAELLARVGIDPQLLGRFPHELSGGQRQRIGIARALAMEPALLVADEPVSSLDVSLQGQIINLLRMLNESLGLTIVLISHDLAVVARICDHVAVMYGGQVVESGHPDRVLRAPTHPYTRALLDAVPRGLQRRGEPRRVLPPDSAIPTAGCRFRPRCQQAMPVCERERPTLTGAGDRHLAACHLIPSPDGASRSAEPADGGSQAIVAEPARLS